MKKSDYVAAVRQPNLVVAPSPLMSLHPRTHPRRVSPALGFNNPRRITMLLVKTYKRSHTFHSRGDVLHSTLAWARSDSEFPPHEWIGVAKCRHKVDWDALEGCCRGCASTLWKLPVATLAKRYIHNRH
jgi:hypothetical protein